MDQVSAITSLRSVGMPEKAAEIYLSLLGTTKATISEIARTTGVKRATCYEYIDHLLKENFIERLPIGKRMYYSAIEPKKVLQSFRKKATALENTLNELEKVHDTAVNKPRIVFYEGKRELRQIYEDLFKTVGDAYSIFPAETFFQNFTEEDYDEFDKEISAHALKSRDLFVADKHYRKIKEIRAKNGGEKLDKRLPSSFTSNVDVLIFSDKVALISLRDLSAIVIENKDIADLFKNMHSFMWKSL